MNFREVMNLQALNHVTIDGDRVVSVSMDSAGNFTFVTEDAYHRSRRYHVKWHQNAPATCAESARLPSGICSFLPVLEGGQELTACWRVFSCREDVEAWVLPQTPKACMPKVPKVPKDPKPNPGATVRQALQVLKQDLAHDLGLNLRAFEEATGMYVLNLNVQLIRNIDGTLNYVVPEVDVGPTLE